MRLTGASYYIKAILCSSFRNMIQTAVAAMVLPHLKAITIFASVAPRICRQLCRSRAAGLFRACDYRTNDSFCNSYLTGFAFLRSPQHFQALQQCLRAIEEDNPLLPTTIDYTLVRVDMLLLSIKEVKLSVTLSHIWSFYDIVFNVEKSSGKRGQLL